MLATTLILMHFILSVIMGNQPQKTRIYSYHNCVVYWKSGIRWTWRWWHWWTWRTQRWPKWQGWKFLPIFLIHLNETVKFVFNVINLQNQQSLQFPWDFCLIVKTNLSFSLNNPWGKTLFGIINIFCFRALATQDLIESEKNFQNFIYIRLVLRQCLKSISK